MWVSKAEQAALLPPSCDADAYSATPMAFEEVLAAHARQALADALASADALAAANALA